MSGNWEWWNVETRYLIGCNESDVEALVLVRELTAKGWPISATVLTFGDPALAGQELARPAGLTGSDQTRRTA